MIMSIKNPPENMPDNSNDTSIISDPSSRNFLTSTPRQLRVTCEECQKKCEANHHLEIHKKKEFTLGHGQAAQCTSYIVLQEVP